MRRKHACTAILGIIALVLPAEAQYQLVWEDDFDGSSLDLGKWEPQIGTGCPSLCGWGNNELQYYRSQNATVSGGLLRITAREEAFGGRPYTSARLRTRNLGDWERGRFEMRAKLPIGQGIWPAFWMLPTDNVYGTWAASGEIDIMEYVGHDPDRVFGTIHHGGAFPGNVFSGGGYTLPTGTFHDDFHVFALEWDEFEMRWYVDGNLYSTKTSWWSTGGPYPAPFDQRFHLLLNTAVGGNLPGSPDPTTVFPQDFVIDYVRVYQEPDPSACASLFDDMDHSNPFGNGYFVFSGGGSGGIGANGSDVPPIQGGSASLDVGWGSGGVPGYFGGFGRTNPLGLDGATHLELWIHPDAGQDYRLEINLQDDDNGDNSIPGNPDGADDEFQYTLHVSPTGPGAISGSGWQRVAIPLASFVDDNTFHFGGNGIFDPYPTGAGGNGQLVNVVFALISNSGADVTFRTDHWAFTRRASAISGRVWADIDGNGQGAGEPGLSGVTVELFDASLGSVVATDVTSGAGEYSFASLLDGSFVVRVVSATLPAGVLATFDPDGLATLDEFALDLSCDETAADRDFGYAPTPSSNYCVGAPNSAGPGASIFASGSTSVAANDFTLEASGSIPGASGIFYYGPVTTQVAFGDGFRCVAAGGGIGTSRLLPPVVADGGGGAQRLVDFTLPPANQGSGALVPGATWNFQWWYRDVPSGNSGFNLSDGLSVTILP